MIADAVYVVYFVGELNTFLFSLTGAGDEPVAPFPALIIIN